MRTVIVRRAGGHERLEIETAPDLQPERGEVLIDVKAIGVNYADCVVRMGLYASAKKYVGWPITPGFEVAGVVSGVGQDVSGVRVGDEVIGVTRFGGYATQISLPQHQVFALPEGLDFAQGATLPAVFMTAWFALMELAHPRPGQDVLVHSASGGVGGALLQMLRILECRSVGVVGAPHKVDLALAHGARAVIDKSAEDLWAAAEALCPEGFHIVLDANGVSTLAHSYDHLAQPGKLVVYGFHSMLPRQGGRPNWFTLARDWLRTPRFNPLDMTGDNRSVLAFNLSYLFEDREMLSRAMGQLLGWFKSGALGPLPVVTYPFEKVADAHRDLESAQTVGKLALVV